MVAIYVVEYGACVVYGHCSWWELTAVWLVLLFVVDELINTNLCWW